jgi:hypothetical protein
MNVYMLRDKVTGYWYVRRGAWQAEPEGAAIWTTIGGPRSAKGAITLKQHTRNYPGQTRTVREPEIVVLTVNTPE